MNELIPTTVVLIFGTFIAVAWTRRFERREASFIIASYVAHAVAAFAQVWITREVYGIGDLIFYWMHGREIARLLRYDMLTYLPEVLAVLFQQSGHLPVELSGGQTTQTMLALSGLVLWLVADSLYAMCLVVSLAVFYAQLAIYRVFRDRCPAWVRTRLLIAVMLMPSVVYWTSAMLKEPVALAGFGWVVFGMHLFLSGRRGVGLLILALGAIPPALVKPYILFAFVPAAGFWWYWQRAWDRSAAVPVIKPFYLGLTALAGLGALVALGEIFPRYSLENIAEETARMQEVGTTVIGGSNYFLTDNPDRTVAGQLAFAPIAFITTLFRPFIFESKNILMLLNALETTALTIVFIRAVGILKLGHAWRATIRSPLMVFCVVFVIGLGVAIGLASTNLGSLSRYRAPLMPFFAALVLLWDAEARRAPARASEPRATGLAIGRQRAPARK